MPLSLNSIILSVCKPREYFGKEAQIHKTILDICRRFLRIELLTALYERFDEACLYVIVGSYRFSSHKNEKAFSSLTNPA